jgi:hypothetical protein
MDQFSRRDNFVVRRHVPVAAIYTGPEESCNTPAFRDARILIDRLS